MRAHYKWSKRVSPLQKVLKWIPFNVLFDVLNIYVYFFSPDSKHEVSGSETDIIYLLNISVLVSHVPLSLRAVWWGQMSPGMCRGSIIPWRTTEIMTLGAYIGTAAQEPPPPQRGREGNLIFFSGI